MAPFHHAPATRRAGLLRGPYPLTSSQAPANLTAGLGNGGNPNLGWWLTKEQANIKTVRIESGAQPRAGTFSVE